MAKSATRRKPRLSKVQVVCPRTGEVRMVARHRTIPAAKMTEVDKAWRFAIDSGVPLNAFVTINWELAPPVVEGTPAMDRSSDFRGALKSAYYRSLKRHGLSRDEHPFAWIEVRENPEGRGEHVHIAMHVPEACDDDMRDAIRRLVEHQSVNPKSGAVDIRPVGPRWWDRRNYMLKGGSEAGLDQIPGAKSFRRSKGSQGITVGPRVRVSHSLGPTARKAAEKAHLVELSSAA